MAEGGPFPADALEANRAGRLSREQTTWLRTLAKSSRGNMRSFAAIAGGLGLIVLLLGSNGGLLRVLLGVGLLVLAGYFLVRSLLGADPVDADLRDVRVESVGGAILKRKETTRTRTSSVTTYYIDVDNRQLVAFRDQYEAAPEAGYVRVYYVPHSMRVVNLEHLPNPPGTPDTVKSPADLLKLAAAGMLGFDETGKAEARAKLAAIGEGMTAGAPPPAADRDPRPLAEAIVGRWTNGMITIEFAAGGTVVATLPGGMQRTASWSVDAQGRLVADLMGEQEAGEAWVSGDTLSITQEGRGMAFHRA